MQKRGGTALEDSRRMANIQTTKIKQALMYALSAGATLQNNTVFNADTLQDISFDLEQAKTRVDELLEAASIAEEAEAASNMHGGGLDGGHR